MRKFHYALLSLVITVGAMTSAAPGQPSNAFQVDAITLGTNRSVQLQWHSATNALYQIQYAQALKTNTAWQFASTNFTSAGSTSLWTDTGTTSAVQRYYRMIQASNLVDRFGIRMVYPTVTNGREWFSTWDNGHARNFTAFGNPDTDPYDPWYDVNHGDASYKIDGAGIMKVTGSTPRMYVHSPDITNSAGTVDWHHGIECTAYFMRVADQNTAYAGMEFVVRSNHGTTAPELQNLCDTRGIDGRMRYDGNIDFEKETSHPNSTAVDNQPYWTNGMPFNVWIGYKLAVYDLTNGNVMLELYIDETDGLNGGNWKKLNEFTDTGANFGVGGVACTNGIDPALRLTASDTRPGSESGKPNITVYSRTDNIGTDGIWYKKESIREISP